MNKVAEADLIHILSALRDVQDLGENDAGRLQKGLNEQWFNGSTVWLKTTDLRHLD